MTKEEYDSVVKDMRLPNGLLFGLPIVLDTDRDDIVVGDKVGARGRDWLGGGCVHVRVRVPVSRVCVCTQFCGCAIVRLCGG